MWTSRRFTARTGNVPKGSPTTTSRSGTSTSTRRSSRSNSSFFEDHLCDRMLGGVRYGEVDDLGPTLSEDAQSLPTDVQGRNALLIVHHLDVVPGDLSPPSRLYSLQERLLRREPPRVTLRGRRFFSVAIFALGWGEDTFAETRRSRHRFGDTVDFNYVDAGGNDHGRC